ncbi:hypothetical protein JTB14_002793 [Gonioctena quinquepunctata]|nr:hypothetical protein JTB14_002793 [Gonioctena quinquepunctata]
MKFEIFQVAGSEVRISPDMSTAVTNGQQSDTTDFTKHVFGGDATEHVIEENKTCGKILTVLSWVVVVLTMPFSLMVCFKVSLFINDYA